MKTTKYVLASLVVKALLVNSVVEAAVSARELGDIEKRTAAQIECSVSHNDQFNGEVIVRLNRRLTATGCYYGSGTPNSPRVTIVTNGKLKYFFELSVDPVKAVSGQIIRGIYDKRVHLSVIKEFNLSGSDFLQYQGTAASNNSAINGDLMAQVGELGVRTNESGNSEYSGIGWASLTCGEDSLKQAALCQTLLKEADLTGKRN